MQQRYPIPITRDLGRAKYWIREHARGNERYGLVASSQARRLKPHAIDVRIDVNPIHYFLNDRHDTRSSWYLEDAATDFQIQGLELEWIGMTCDADLRLSNGRWRHHSFRGDGWQNVHKGRPQAVSARRLSRPSHARPSGMVIFVPPGDDADPTRQPGFYDETSNYLAALGRPSA